MQYIGRKFMRRNLKVVNCKLNYDEDDDEKKNLIKEINETYEAYCKK